MQKVWKWAILVWPLFDQIFVNMSLWRHRKYWFSKFSKNFQNFFFNLILLRGFSTDFFEWYLKRSVLSVFSNWSSSIFRFFIFLPLFFKKTQKNAFFSPKNKINFLSLIHFFCLYLGTMQLRKLAFLQVSLHKFLSTGKALVQMGQKFYLFYYFCFLFYFIIFEAIVHILIVFFRNSQMLGNLHDTFICRSMNIWKSECWYDINFTLLNFY